MPSPGQKLRIIVGGLVGQYPLGGVAWDYFHYLLGLAELGHDVYYHEDTWVWPIDPVKRYADETPDYTIRFLRRFFEDHAPHLSDRWHYVLCGDEHFGMSEAAFDEVARSADVFLNISGACEIPESLSPRCLKVFMDTDPGYNQILLHERHDWSDKVDDWCAQVAAHDRHLTYAENIYADDCVVPRMDFDWLPTRCVVTLPQWEGVRAEAPPAGAPFTTVMSWQYFGGPLTYRGVEYHSKIPEYEKFRTLPRRAPVPITLAISGDTFAPDDVEADGWTLVDALDSSVSPAAYQRFIRQSAGEWSIAKNVYVATRSGWFSCRTACYLAAGRPAVVQDTCWSRYVPSGLGLLAFTTMDETVDALNRVAADPGAHRAAAYEIAREYLAPDRVLPPMLDALFRPKGAGRTAPRPPGLGDVVPAKGGPA